MGTGDDPKDLDERRSPAKFEIGAMYDSAWNQPVKIIANNNDGDVQVMFPESKSGDENQQFTVDKSQVHDLIARGQEAMVLDELNPGLSSRPEILRNPLDWIPIFYDGLLIPSCDFALVTNERITDEIQRNDPSRASNLAQQHGGLSRDKYHVAFLGVDQLIGKVLADEIDIPKYHFGVKHHPLRALCETAMDKEFNTLVRKGVFGE
jgi:hypothetical protein